MAKVLVTEQYLEDIADAIRTKLSVGTVYTPGQMAAAILTIVGGGVENIAYSNGTLSKTINGATSTVFTADSTPTSASTNPVTSGGVYTSISAANAQISNILGDMATVESTSTASKNYVIGEYLVLNGVFYKVTSPIAQNGTITPGTNCDATTAGAELAALNSNTANLESKFTDANSGLRIFNTGSGGTLVTDIATTRSFFCLVYYMSGNTVYGPYYCAKRHATANFTTDNSDNFSETDGYLTITTSIAGAARWFCFIC